MPGKATSIQSSITSNQKDQDALNTQLAATQARLKAQYTALDSTMSQANALAAYVQQQFYAKIERATRTDRFWCTPAAACRPVASFQCERLHRQTGPFRP